MTKIEPLPGTPDNMIIVLGSCPEHGYFLGVTPLARGRSLGLYRIPLAAPLNPMWIVVGGKA